MKRIFAERSVLGAFGATVLCIGLLVAWTKELRPGWLIAAALAHVLASWLLLRSIRRGRLAVSAELSGALAFVLIAIGTATVFSWNFQQLEDDWTRLQAQAEDRLSAALHQRMEDVIARGRRAARDVAALTPAGPRALFRELEAIRSRHGVDGVATFSATGELVAWAGEHWGRLRPDSLLSRGTRPYFHEGPLFSYLYFPEPGRDGGRAVAALLLETGSVRDVGPIGVADAFADRWRARATFRRAGRSDADWALTGGADTVVHARIAPRTQAEWRGDLNRGARRLTLVAALAGFALLGLAWLRWTAPAHARWAAAVPLVLAIPLIAGLPLRGALGPLSILEPTLFVLTLPGRGDISLGRLIALLLPLIALVVGVRRTPHRGRVAFAWLVGGTLAVAAAYPLLLEVFFQAATRTLREGSATFWFGFHLALVLALGGMTVLAFPRTADNGDGRWPVNRRARRVLVAAGVVLSAALAVATAPPPDPGEPLRLGMSALWAFPFVLLAVGTARPAGRVGAIGRAVAAAWLAGTAVLPQLWGAHVQARLEAAENNLNSLGSHSDTDTFLDYLLESFGTEALTRFAAGEEDVLLLYRTWVGSDLAKRPYPARIVLWSPQGLPELQLGSAPALDSLELQRLVEIVAETRQSPLPHLEPFTDLPSQSRMVAVSLPDGSVITVVVPPRRTLEETSTIAPFLGVVGPTRTKLHLIAPGGEPARADTISWMARQEGWRSETWVKYPEGWYHAHLLVTVPPIHVRLARATLLLAFDLAVFTLLWVLGVVARGRTAVPRGDWTGWLGSFRARVTVALFAFFLIPTALFGWVAYRALAGEVARAAETIAQYSVAQAVVDFPAVLDLQTLAAHARTDVLRYVGGELIDASSQEAEDLGIYSGWMPPPVYLELVATRESREAVHEQTLGNRSYVVAFATLDPAGTLGVPLALNTGDAAARQQEFAHMVLFAAVVGALLSLALSLAVGRSLAGPIGRLRWAATVVGAGKLHVRLPEARGEFGQLFAAFNRMVRRLRRARAREIRTARVLAWGEMARQVAHEIKNPLTPIKLSVQHLRRAYGDRHPQFEEILDGNVTQILSEIDRLSDIARAFSRYGAPAEAAGPLASVDAPTVIRDALTLYRSGDRSIRYIDAVDPDLPRVRARVDELKEVLLNLVENARIALNGGGDVVVRGRVVDERVEIAVSDNGPGITPELLPRIFDPHFSTRSLGTGLGLAIVRRIVESWGGTVTAESEVGQGTTVSMRLLRVD